MLVARNYYLTREKRFSRKFTEVFVAWKLESELSKQEILELFLNKIPFGHRAAGLGAASQVYYGKKLDQLDLAQLATLAGIPNGPSIFNPISKPDLARNRRKHVLGRMLAQEHITPEIYENANNQPIKTFRHGAKITVDAPYVAEMVHMDLIRRFGRDAAHSEGLKVYTSLNPELQIEAQKALRESLLEYDRRHGYRNVEQHYDLDDAINEKDRRACIQDFSQIGSLIPALVLETNLDYAKILLADGSHGKILLKDSLWARRYVDENHREFGKLKDINQVITPGDVIRVILTDRVEQNPQISADLSAENTADGPDALSQEIVSPTLESIAEPLSIYLLSQIPDVNAGFVVLNPQNGSIQALAGGFNFNKTKFNMVTQATRQLGSNIKPFIYSAALEKGFTAASLINDSPYIENDASAGNFWRPENDSGNYRGPTRLRVALSWSINTVAIRLIKKFGPPYAKRYLQSIGFSGQRMQPYPSLALGSASFTPLEVATGYATFANGGFKVDPWYIHKIEDSHGQILFEHQPVEVCEECIAVIEARKADELEKQTNNLALETVETKTDSSDPKKNSAGEAMKLGQIDNSQDLQFNAKKPIQNMPLLKVAEDKVAPRVIEARNRYIIDSILKDVIHKGTAWRPLNNSKSALLRRNDIAGKTGTTNEVKDAWFSGYNSQYVASAWVGFVDHSKKLGKREFGGKAALPIWQKFMEKALKGTKQFNLPRPNGIVDVKIDLTNGKLASANTQKSDFELFRIENVPTEYSEPPTENIFDQLDDTLKKDTKNDDSEVEIDFD